jgi:hypothetical protein
LLKQKNWSSLPFEIYHFHDGDKKVYFILEQSDKTIIGIEIKSSTKLNADTWKGLKDLQK